MSSTKRGPRGKAAEAEEPGAAVVASAEAVAGVVEAVAEGEGAEAEAGTETAVIAAAEAATAAGRRSSDILPNGNLFESGELPGLPAVFRWHLQRELDVLRVPLVGMQVFGP